MNHDQGTSPPRDGSACHEVLRSLRKLNRAMDLHSRRLVQKYGLTGPQLLILQELASLGEVSSGELAESISLSGATVTGILDRLEKRGLVARRRSEEDKRRVLVRTTSRCERMLEPAPPLLQESFVRQYENLQPWEQAMILSSLQRLVTMMEAAPLETAHMLEEEPVLGESSGRGRETDAPVSGPPFQEEPDDLARMPRERGGRRVRDLR
jgi:DNA-binding MarR family transcriptional regulator